MITFINMDYNSSTTQWWIDYDENGIDNRNYYNTKEEAYIFYYQII
jgi:hypothetical protein